MAKQNKVNIYNFNVGTKSYLYTNYDRDIVSGGLLYKAIQIKRGDILSTASDDRANLDVSVIHTMEKPNDVVNYFKRGMPYNTITLSIKEIPNTLTPDVTINLWYGEVNGVDREISIATFNCVPLAVMLNTKMTRETYQTQCPKFLYDERCKLNIEDFKFPVTVLEINANIIKVDRLIPTGGNPTIYKMKAGIAISSLSEYKMIVDVNEATKELTLLVRFSDVKVGDVIELAPGCDRTSARCKEFNNFENFGGFEFVPNRNKFIP